MAVLNTVRARLRRLAVACVACATSCAPAWAQAQAQSEAGLRAAMVYNLMLFVEWPTDALQGEDTRLCLVSESTELSRSFNALDGRRLRGRTLRTQRRGALTGLDDCHAVYFDGLETSLLADKLAALAGMPVLTISSEPGGQAMIDLALGDGRLVFDVSASALRSGRLGLAARVMQLARTVHRP